jgi:hypothetical protein
MDQHRKEARQAAHVEVRSLHDHTGAGAFDREFWRTVPPSDKLAMTWEMVLDYLAWRQPDALQSRLQRSVCRVEQRRR